MIVLLDGVQAPGGRAAFPLDDPALTLGFAVFETLRTYSGAPYALDAHLARLAASAHHCGLTHTEEVVRAEIAEVIGAMDVDAKINVYLTGGGRRIVSATPLDLARVGAPVRVVSRPWSPPSWLPGHVKHTSRLAWALAAKGVDEALWEVDGHWTEANRSNLFAVQDGVWCTPPDDGTILSGVTRAGLLAAARGIGLHVREARVPVGPYDELYLSSTLKELAPIVAIDGVANRGAGPVGAAVLRAFRASVP